MGRAPRQSVALARVLASAARLQEVVPDAVLVGGTAAAMYAGHRESLDHDHVLTDLADRYAEILDAVEASEGWATSVRASKPPMTILGSLDGIEAGLRQLRRRLPLETCEIEVGPGMVVTAPTEDEVLRVKSYLVVQRNVVRDYLDVVAMAEHLGMQHAIGVLSGIDTYYRDRSDKDGSVLTALVLALAKPSPRDREVTQELPSYKGLDPRWHDWASVAQTCQQLALGLAEAAQ